MNVSEPEPSSTLRAFWHGASRPSLVAAVGAILLGLGQIAVAAAILTTERVARFPLGFLMEDAFDYYGYVTQQALKMSSANGAPPTVVLFGTSASRCALADHDAFGRRLGEAVGRTVDFRLLATGSQTLWEASAVAEHLPADLSGVVLVEISPWRLGAGPERLRELIEQPRLGLDSRILRDAARAEGFEIPEPTGRYLIDHGPFLVSRRWTLLRNALFGPPKYSEVPRNTHHVVDEQRMLETVEVMEERMAAFTEGGAQAAPVLRELVAELRRRPGLRVALFQSVVHPRLLGIYGDRYPAYLEFSAALANELDLPLWQPGTEARLETKDFRDWIHIYTRDAQDRYADALANELVPILTTTTSGAGS